jgi:hypothetical protein
MYGEWPSGIKSTCRAIFATNHIQSRLVKMAIKKEALSRLF